MTIIKEYIWAILIMLSIHLESAINVQWLDFLPLLPNTANYRNLIV